MPKKDINLLPKEEFEKKPLGKFLIWALSAGRWIVIAVELIVILAFLSRFKLDRDIAALHESIRKKQAIITSMASFEQDFLSLQERLLTIDKIQKTQLGASKIIDAVSAVTPPEVILSSFSLEGGVVSLKGAALSEIGLKSFLKGLTASPLFNEVSVSNISKQTSSEAGIQFNVKATTGKAVAGASKK